MRAWAVVENEAPLAEIELPTPEPKGTEVLLETIYCGVCHSDLRIWEGRRDLGGGKVMNLRDRGLTLPLSFRGPGRWRRNGLAPSMRIDKAASGSILAFEIPL